jgi:histidyl-tRNA synthetase
MFRHDKPQFGRYRELRQFGVEIIGSEKSIMDAMVIKTSLAIFEEVGIKNTIVKVNSIGDKESRKKYEKDLTTYYKKHKNKICKTCIERLSNSPLRLLDCKEESCQPFKNEAPKAMASLNPESKQHFKEVLKYLDEMGIDYEIDHTLMRGLDYYSHTIFEFINKLKDKEGNLKEMSIGGGGRYDYLAKAMGYKKDVPGVGMSLGVDRILLCEGAENVEAKIQKKPKVFFIQLGFEAKLKSLQIIEQLRKAKIPIAQSLSKDSLAIQLGMTERLEIPYALIYGQKEAMDKEVIVRNMATRSQETVKIENLVDHIKKLK